MGILVDFVVDVLASLFLPSRRRRSRAEKQ